MSSQMLRQFPAKGGTFFIEPDASSGSYFWAARFLMGPSGLNSPPPVKDWPRSRWQVHARFPRFFPLPRVIFITAHDKFALRAFEVHAFDYLLKPVSEERFREALRRARIQHEQSADGFASRFGAMLEQLQREKSLPDRLLVEEGSRGVFVPIKEIAWVEADRNYVLLHCAKKTHTLRSTLDALQNSLDPKLFVRINRGTLVRLDAIRELLPWFHGEYKVMLHDNTELRWSRRYVTQRPELLKLT